MKRRTSRRATPWEGNAEMTPTQEFLHRTYVEHYEQRHLPVGDSGESELINSHTPTRCPHCSSEVFKRFGHTQSGVQRYKCECGKTFLPTTGTIFDEHRISISEWVEYCLNLFRYVSITADSWNNKNDYKTSKFWLEKLFLTIENTQDSIVLSGEVWLDETFYSVRLEDIKRNSSGGKLSGISSNQICIGVATDKKHTILLVEGTGRPSQKSTFEAFGTHIEPGSTLIHDGDSAHNKLVKQLELKSVTYTSKSLKGVPDNENPLFPINRVHAMLKTFLYSHRSFNRSSMQNYLNLFAFISNPPSEPLEKVEQILNLAFQNPKSLHFRDVFPESTDLAN